MSDKWTNEQIDDIHKDADRLLAKFKPADQAPEPKPFAIRYLEQQYRKLDPSYTGSSLEADVAKAESAIRASERERCLRQLQDLHMAQTVNNQNHSSDWHDAIDAGIAAIREMGDE